MPTSPRLRAIAVMRLVAMRVTIAVAVLLTPLAHLTAQTNLQETAAALVPADAGFFGTMLRTGEQWQMLMSSKAMATLQQNPFVQIGLAQFREQWNDPQDENLRQFKSALELPENQELLALLQEAVSTEIFCYGDATIGEVMIALNELNSRVQFAQFEALEAGDDPSSYILTAMMELFLERSAELNTPRMVIGMRINNREAADRQLTRLGELAQMLPDLVPQLQGKIRSHSLNQGDYVTLQVDGSMLPWRELEREFEGDAETFERFRSAMVRKTAAVSIGVRGSYLLFSIGPNGEHLARLGKGDNLLSRKELQPVVQNAHRKLTGVAYSSGELLKKLTNVQGSLENFENSMNLGLSVSDLSEEMQEKISGYFSDLLGRLSQMAPEPGSVVTFEFLTDRGYESFHFDWGEKPTLDFSQPLHILQHVGGNPVIMAAGNAKAEEGSYGEFKNVLQGLIELADEIAGEELEGAEKAEYERFRDTLLPLVKRLDIANRELLAPAFRNSQTALVIDFRLKSAQPHIALPATTSSVPLPELAIVCSIADAEKVKQGIAEYFAVAQEIADAMHQASPDDIPAFQIPRPENSKVAQGELFRYALPAELGLDDNLAPTGGLNSDVVVFATSAETAQRILKPTPPAFGGLLADDQQKLAGAAAFDFPAFVDAVSAWTRYGFAAYTQGNEGPVDVASVVLPFEDVLLVLKCYRGSTSVTYREGDAVVTHSEHVFEDLP